MNQKVYTHPRDRRLSKPRVTAVDHVPRTRAQRSAPPAPPVAAEPANLGSVVGRYTSSDRLGRLPCIGLDAGAIPGTVPGANLH